MIYTVELIETFQRAVDGGGPLIKLGRRAGYEGGWVWSSVGAAYDFLERRHSTQRRHVFGVEADWDEDTIAVPDQPYRLLKRDAALVRLDLRE